MQTGERRQVSVLFTDMVGYTAAIDTLGEERALPFTRAIHDILTKTVQDLGGTVRSFAGDSIMAVFGVPTAFEDTALRACRAAIAIHAAFQAAGDQLAAQYGIRPVMRVGVSSGLAVMAPVQGDDAALSAVGTVVNLASRVQSLAPAGQSLICEATRRQVEWQTDLSFEGEHTIKGIGRPQKLWRLRAVRPGTTRFDVSLARGLNPLVGRDKDLAALLQALEKAPVTQSLVDIVAEAGMGKTRLVFELSRRAEHSGAVVMTGHCTADGRNTPLLPFLEVVRDAFRLRPEDEPADIAAKLETGLRASGLASQENLGLMLNLLGLTVPEGVLGGLDGVLIGLRTRDLLLRLLKARTQMQTVVLLIEDLHWVDTMSQDLLARLVSREDQRNLLVVTTHRPEYALPYAGRPDLVTLALRPLENAEFKALVQSRLGVDNLPDQLLLPITERAGGNPLFGEEILSLLLQQGALRIEAGQAHLTGDLGGGAMPVGVQNLMTARIDSLQPADRALLQSAAVIGLRFDPGLVAALMPDPGVIGATLQRLQDLDLLVRADNSADYAFRHVLLRDTVYEGLLTEHKQALHLAVAEALERRSGNRLTEVAEALAYHYGQAAQSRQAFTYSAMAGTKALGIYSLDLADQFFAQAMALYDADPTCASDAAFSSFIADYGLTLNISMRVKTMLALAERVDPTLRRIGDSRHHVHFLHHLVVCLICSAAYVRAQDIRTEMSAMAERLDDEDARAYAVVTDIALSCHFVSYPADVFEVRRAKALAAISRLDDAYLRNYLYAYLGFDKVNRGLVNEANELADQMIQRGNEQNDARSLGYGTAMKGLVALCTDDYATAMQKSVEALGHARVEWERMIALGSRIAAQIPLEMPGAIEEISGFVQDCYHTKRTLMANGSEAMWGVGMVMQGRIGEGIAHIRSAIAKREAEGNMAVADWSRMYLCEVYLAILSGQGDASPKVLIRNLGAILRVMVKGPSEVAQMVDKIRSNHLFSPNGHYIARCEMILGLMHKAKKKRSSAIDHLTKALRIIEHAGTSPLRSRIEGALTELGAAAV